MNPLVRRMLVRLLWMGPLRRLRIEQPTVVVVAGSVGKTSTKEAVALVLLQSGRPVVKTYGNLATDTGIPLSLLGYTCAPRGVKWLKVLWKSVSLTFLKPAVKPYYVLEYSSDKPGDIAFLTAKIPADIGIITQVASVHMQFFRDQEELVREETALALGLAKEGRLIINEDDPNQYSLEASKKYTLAGLDITMQAQGLRFIREGIVYQTTVLGRHQLYPLLAAIAVGEIEGIPSTKVQKAIASYVVPAGRGRLIQGKNNIQIIDDTYNSSPKAAMEALKMLRSFAGKHRSVAILGRMNELGAESERLHAEVGAQATEVGLLVLIGEYAGVMTRAAVRAGQPLTKIASFVSPEEAIDQIELFLHSEDVVLVKGSQNGVKLERLVKKIMIEPEKAEELLVRQSG